MKKHLIWLLAGLVLISYSAKSADFDLVRGHKKVTIAYAADDAKLTSIVAGLFAKDIERVTGYLPKVVTGLSGLRGNVIIIGSEKSDLIRGLKLKGIDGLSGKWECYDYRRIKNLNADIKDALVIAGSDLRGTAYGVFNLSQEIGVSPWYWWADVHPEKKAKLALDIQDFSSATPSVQYRGIFINDEDWGLQPWAAKTFEPETGDIGPKTYARVFELLLRLKANLILPAMHPSTKAFYHYPGNKKIAADYDIVIGTSHAEPMLRNNVDEWDAKKYGDFNYLSNKSGLLNYWESRVIESKVNNAIYSMGMRGVHDSAMEGVKSAKEAVPLLERIFDDQRDLLKKHINANITSVPQAFTMYKEVLEIYANGLKVPEDITLVWPDDNYGYIQQLSNQQEAKRKGGTGIYYHASYWGRPHDYLWLGTTHPALIRSEMMKAYESNARKIWVLNVGDIKPNEYDIQLFLDMAYDASPFTSASYTKTHLLNWSSAVFGAKNARPAADMLWKHYQYAFERRPEFMGWSQTEPSTPVAQTGYQHNDFGDEAQRRLADYAALERQVSALTDHIPEGRKDAYYQLLAYPIRGAAQMSAKFLNRDKAVLYGKQGRLSAGAYLNLAKKNYNNILQQTRYYNDTLANGKWQAMMSMKPRDLPVFRSPELEIPKVKATESFSLSVEGSDPKPNPSGRLELPVFNSYTKGKYFIDLYLTAGTPADFQVGLSADWISSSVKTGRLTPDGLNSEHRIWISINWSKAPRRKALEGFVRLKVADKQFEVAVKVNNETIGELEGFNGHIKSDGSIMIPAARFSKIVNGPAKGWGAIEDIGSESPLMRSWPLNTAIDTTERSILENPVLQYEFYNFSNGPSTFNIFTLPTFPIHEGYQMRYAVRLDDGPLKVLNFKTTGRTKEWKENVLRNNALRSFEVPFLKAGKHRLSVYMVDPGVVLDKIYIDLGKGRIPYGDH